MKKRRIYLFSSVLLGLFLVGFCVSKVIAAKKPKHVWKWATLGQDTIKMVSILTVDMTRDVLKLTNGDLKFVWYMGGVMGDEEDYVAKMRIGQLQGAMISGTSNAMVCPGISVLELPFIFNDLEEVCHVREKIRPTIYKLTEKNGFKLLAMGSFDEHFYSAKYPMRRPEDFEKSKFLTWHGPLEVEVLKALGASPIPVNVPEVVPSMRSGVVDGAISPSIWWLAAQLYPITKYLNPIPIRYDQAVFIVLLKEWNKLPSNQQKGIQKLWVKVEKIFEKEAVTLSEEAKRGMIDYGCIEVKMTPKEIEVFKKRTRPVWDNMAGKVYSRELLDEVLGHIKDYRAKKGKKR
ncbi:MAG: TRAP transporter substrate-binding protein DctP [Spirochaetota bacterium]|nr:TRAP transporter substrate-binding protein DctP [Spirochaetota bacterium]